jgi:hypothetical protein
MTKQPEQKKQTKKTGLIKTRIVGICSNDIWTEGILSIFGRPVHLWLDAMRKDRDQSDIMVKALPQGLFESPALSYNSKIYTVSFAALCAASVGVMAASGVGLVSLGLTALGALGSIDHGRHASVVSSVLSLVGTCTAVGAGSFFGMGLLPIVGVGALSYGVLCAPRLATKMLYMGMKAPLNLPGSLVLGGITGMAASGRSVGYFVKSFLKTAGQKIKSVKEDRAEKKSMELMSRAKLQKIVIEQGKKLEELEKLTKNFEQAQNKQAKKKPNSVKKQAKKPNLKKK